MTRLQVYKFGGTSVGSAERIREAARLVRACPSPVVVVVSAMGGITNLLVAAADQAEQGEIDRDRLAEISRRHLEAVGDLGLDPDDIARPLLRELEELLVAAAVVHGLTPRIRDRILVTGEKLSARMMAAVLSADGGGPARPLDADTFLETDGKFGEASPLFGVYPPSTRAAIRPLLDASILPVVTGYCGRAPCGSTTTLGRGGSDYSATLVAAALGADEVTIWTDVPGVFSANPSIVPGARVLNQLNYREAGELSYYGAKVLHPSTIQPLIGDGTPVRIKSTFEPDALGTLIDAKATPGTHPVKAVSAVMNHALISIEGTGMAGVPGIAGRIFGTLAREGISVTMISQSSAESSVCIAVPQHRAADAQVALRGAFRLDLAHADVEDIRVQTDTALVAAVGLGMNHTRGVARRVFGAATKAGANIMAIAQGASELNITFAVHQDDAPKTIRSIHDEFGLHLLDPGEDNAAHVDLLLIGFGRVGRGLAALLHERAPAIKARFGIEPRVVGVSDRGGYLFRPTGIPTDTLAEAASAKEAGQGLASFNGVSRPGGPAELIDEAFKYRLSRPIVVDVSDGDSRALHITALERGADTVTANKVPLAGPLAHYRELAAVADRTGRFFRKEATVGAGLPIVDTVEHLVATGDRVRKIEGCFSGSLTYILSRLGKGDPFDEIIREAHKLAYLEPNPLVDLSGEDVRRKAIIISRVAGFEVADDRIGCTSLADRSGLGPDEAPPIDKIPSLCGALLDQAAQAQREGKVLRYVATIEPDEINVRPVPVDPLSPFGLLGGTDNIMSIHTDRYSESPLIISGPGAGIAVTSMGVLTDILRIVAERA